MAKFNPGQNAQHEEFPGTREVRPEDGDNRLYEVIPLRQPQRHAAVTDQPAGRLTHGNRHSNRHSNSAGCDNITPLPTASGNLLRFPVRATQASVRRPNGFSDRPPRRVSP